VDGIKNVADIMSLLFGVV